MSTSKILYGLLNPALYRRLTITRRNAESVFWGVLPHAIEEDFFGEEGPHRTDVTEDKEIPGNRLWPDFIVPYDEVIGEQYPARRQEIHSTVGKPTYPDANTNHRKLTSLSNVRELIIDSLPSVGTTETLQKFYPVFDRTKGKSIKALPIVERLRLTSRFVWEISDLFNYTYPTPTPSSSSGTQQGVFRHTILDFLLLSLPQDLREVVIDYPIFDDQLKAEFIRKRIGLGKGVGVGCGHPGSDTRYRFIAQKWEPFKENFIMIALTPLPGCYKDTHLIIRNVHSSSTAFVRGSTVSLYFLRDPSSTAERVISVDERVEQIMTMLEPPLARERDAALTVKRWEFFSAEVGDGDDKSVEIKVRAEFEAY
ncbi:uncharacterized protein I303_103586 [Kwoniella dejecticola CBS 10117]|uniref:Uncharacterized protein n=1 Tax=Kwoniella dejecticola CBS 10117 TaxID=1296121 RepID=A0A1A6A764_9TREE|nr:uncharacterized protein I303_03608 [Kwoniella dejecticola CBS 10117]OBR85893.1 hypothetical protein I303_03608 [Kwoniella dejecticola CBS 10117]